MALFFFTLLMVVNEVAGTQKSAMHSPVRALNKNILLRHLQGDDNVCSDAVALFKGKFSNIKECPVCNTGNSSDGPSAYLECNSCNYCSKGSCVTETVSGNIVFERETTEERPVSHQCFEFLQDSLITAGQKVCLTESPYACKVELDGAPCGTCEYKDCADGRRRPVANCTNFAQNGQELDFCEPISVYGLYISPFFVFDERFDTENCISSDGPNRLALSRPVMLFVASGLVILSILT